MIRFAAVDWSGAAHAAHRRIATALADDDGRLLAVDTGRGRDETVRRLIALADEVELIVGLDFAFSFPDWFLERHGLDTGPATWRWARERGEELLAGCPSPFWGRPGTRKPHLGPRRSLFRRTEGQVPPVGGIGPKSVFQILGPGAVGTGSLRGMPYLLELKRAGFSIWPFDEPGRPLALEIYPRDLTGRVTKKSRALRRLYLDTHFADQPPELLARAIETEDAFDATVSALVMARHAGELARLRGLEDAVLRREGQIWRPVRDPWSARPW